MPRVPLPDPSNSPPDIEAWAQISPSATCVLIPELETAARTDLLRADAVTPGRLVMFQAARRTQVHDGIVARGLRYSYLFRGHIRSCR